MSQQKQNIVAIGTGQMNENTNTSRIISSTLACNYFDLTVTYPLNAVVETNGQLYRSLVASNVGLDPVVNPNEWRLELGDVHDGDICITVSGAYSNMQQRVGGLWRSMIGQPLKKQLVDGQLTPVSALSYSGAAYPFAEINYTIRRGSGHARKIKGKYTILNDGTSNITFSHEFETIGIDTQVTLTPVINAGIVALEYTSVLNGVDIEFAVDLQGWI